MMATYSRTDNGGHFATDTAILFNSDLLQIWFSKLWEKRKHKKQNIYQQKTNINQQ